ncbi:MAG: hypothetical protein IMY72_10390 [Bacteroidetes bacterium]|nr:hypothetical protein [Bacteroidota bacterium]
MNLKKIFFSITIIFLFISISAVSYNQNCNNIKLSNQRGSDYWNWEPYATLNVKGNPLVVLYYGVRSRGYNGQVKWCLNNLTKKTLYNISINNVEYTLSNNSKVKISHHSFIDFYVYSAKEVYTKPDKLYSSENGNLSLKKINIESPEIFFSLSKEGKIYNWNKLGEIEIEYEKL